MRLNREKIVAVGAFGIFVLGFYGLVVALVTPAPDVALRDTSLPEPARREVRPLEYRRFASDSISMRNPFQFSEGWSRIETLPLGTPPVPGPEVLVPSLGDVGRSPAGTAGFTWIEAPPAEVPTKGGKP